MLIIYSQNKIKQELSFNNLKRYLFDFFFNEKEEVSNKKMRKLFLLFPFNEQTNVKLQIM